MAKKEDTFDPRKYMEMAIAVMKQSIQEPREDKVSPNVGAVLIKSNGEVETAFRGELRHGDHAEFTLLERKNRSTLLEGSFLFATLEPCAPGARKHPKLGCAERIVNARIKKVWIGIEDPDPSVDRKGIKHLIDHGIEVAMFDADLQEEIRNANSQFIKEAEGRALKIKKDETRETVLSEIERAEPKADYEDLSTENLELFIQKAKLDTKINTPKFNRILIQLGLLELKESKFIPTGLGLLLFGNRPQLIYSNALIRATFKTSGRGEDIENIEGPLILQPERIANWYESHIGKQIDRSTSNRQTAYDYPLSIFREAIINAIVHRDYDLEGAPIYFEINDDAIIIKSPGAPVNPIKLEQIKQFNAPSLSRNPKIMYIFDKMGLVEQRGFGFLTIKELPDKFGLPLPFVSFENPYLVFTFPRHHDAIKRLRQIPNIEKLNAEEIDGYHWMLLQGEVSTRDYASHFDYTYKKAQRHLKNMKDLGLVGDNGESINSPNYRYIAIVDSA